MGMTAQEILQALENNPTSGQVADLGLRAVIVPHCLGNLDAIGHIAIPANDGLLLIPYTAVTLGSGWEQLDLDHATRVAEPPRFPDVMSAYAVALDSLAKLLESALFTQEEASS